MTLVKLVSMYPGLASELPVDINARDTVDSDPFLSPLNSQGSRHMAHSSLCMSATAR